MKFPEGPSLITLSIETTEESDRYTQLSRTLQLRKHGPKYISLYWITDRITFGSSGPLSCCTRKERQRRSNFATFLVKSAFSSYTIRVLLFVPKLDWLFAKVFFILQEILKRIRREIWEWSKSQYITTKVKQIMDVEENKVRSKYGFTFCNKQIQ